MKILKVSLIIFLLVFLSSCNLNYNYNNHSKYIESSSFSLDSEITELNISWVNGNINILQSKDAKITVHEENFGDFPMYYYLNGTVLNIEYVKHGTRNDDINDLEKDLNIVLPNSSNMTLDIDLINGNCELDSDDSLQASAYKSIEIELVNGNINFNSLVYSMNDIKIDYVNGNVNAINGVVAESDISIERINGSVNIMIASAKSINIETVNGSDKLLIPTELGYKLDFDSVSGIAHCNGQYIYGDEHIEIDYESVNADLTISLYESMPNW